MFAAQTRLAQNRASSILTRSLHWGEAHFTKMGGLAELKRSLGRRGNLCVCGRAVVQSIENHLASLRLVQDIEVHARNSLINQLAALLNRVVHTDVELGLFVVLDGFQARGQVRGKTRLAHRRNSLDSSEL